MNDRPGFDYIIVGAGSAGSVLANRLSADPSVRVLLLEAGPPDDSWMIRIPAAVVGLMKSETLNWQYNTAPEPELGNRSLYWPRGKTLGGSSSSNAMVYIRGQRQDYDRWAEFGNPGWSWDEVLPYFVKAEDNSRGASEFHGSGGPLHVMDEPEPHPLSRVFVEAGAAAGLPENTDFNGAEQAGVGLYQTTRKNGERWSAARAYIDPARGRPNLQIETGAQVTRVLLDGRRASGVEFIQQGSRHQLHCSREVLLCGGAINSPQLLLLSGIGPRDKLEAHGIAMRHELAGVGENLQDHLDFIVQYHCLRRASMGLAISAIPQIIAALFRFLLRRRGLLTSNFAEAGGFARSQPGLDTPDLQFHFVPSRLEDHGRKLRYGYGISLHVCHLHPASRGRITLHSADPLADARIEPRYLTADGDLQALREGVRLARRVMQAGPFDPYRGQELSPGAGIESDAELEQAIRAGAETVYHPVGSCRMGQDETAVVDERLRVRGLQGLRVVDASIMPTLVGGNTNAPCIMIGEKAADLINSDRKAG